MNNSEDDIWNIMNELKEEEYVKENGEILQEGGFKDSLEKSILLESNENKIKFSI